MLSASVVIATYRRPDDVVRCLDALAGQHRAPEEILVVDASPDARTRDRVAARPGVTYLRNDSGVGTTATSRAIAVERTTCDIVAFLDDDSVPTPEWLAELLAPYADPAVAAVGGRVINSEEEVAAADPTRIGLLLPDGRLTGNFAADPGDVINVAHLLGANMSYRRNAIRQVGGVRDFYPGTCAREDSDLGLRMTRAGMGVKFAPRAVVHHISGEYAKGRRFDRRYQFYTQRNHIVLLSTVFGMRSDYVRSYPGSTAREIADELHTVIRGESTRSLGHRARRVAGCIATSAAKLTGMAAGVVAASRLRRSHPHPRSVPG